MDSDSKNSPLSSNRREFLTGKTSIEGFRTEIELPSGRPAPNSGHTVRLSQRAMACDFSVIMNAGIPKSRIRDASAALDCVSNLEQQLTVYRDDSEVSCLNRKAAKYPVPVESRLFQLLLEARTLHLVTEGAFDPTAGPLVALWRRCRGELRVPRQAEIDACLSGVGMRHVDLDTLHETVRFDRDDVELNLGGIGKGYALDRAAEGLGDQAFADWLLHGGHSSLLARGSHNGLDGWPVGIGNPLFTGKRLGTILLKDRAMATSGSNIQYFRHQGRKYGHILDPRTGWPVETMLSVTVFAPTAAVADALSTAFYVMGVEKVVQCCDNLEGVGAILIPHPRGRELRPVVLGIPSDQLFLDAKQLSHSPPRPRVDTPGST